MALQLDKPVRGDGPFESVDVVYHSRALAMLTYAVRTKIPRIFRHGLPTSPDGSEAGQTLLDSRNIPTPPDCSDHPQPSFNL